MRKLILTIKDNVNISDALIAVREVIKTGRISDEGRAYCYVTQFPLMKLIVYANRNKASDTFTVMKEKHK